MRSHTLLSHLISTSCMGMGSLLFAREFGFHGGATNLAACAVCLVTLGYLLLNLRVRMTS